MKKDCKHENFQASVDVNCLEDSGGFMADVRIKCADCGEPFRFLGLPMGLNLCGAAVSVDKKEARLAIEPDSRTVSAVPPITGYGVRLPGH